MKDWAEMLADADRVLTELSEEAKSSDQPTIINTGRIDDDEALAYLEVAARRQWPAPTVIPSKAFCCILVWTVYPTPS